MSRTKVDTKPEAPPPEPTPAGMTADRLESPILKIVTETLAPYIRHRDGCPGDDGCTCGLVAALVDVQRRERLVRRYGTE